MPKVPTTDRYEVPRKALTLDDVRRLLEKELMERQRAHGEYLALGLADEAERLQTEIELLAAYL